MKVTDVRAAYPKWRQRPPADAWQAHFWQIAVRVTTDAGVIGHGYGGGGQPAVHVINDHFSRFLVGRTIDGTGDIAAAWDELYRVSIPYGRGGLAQMALSGVDLALWDALARAERCPVHRLIGPRTKGRVPAYATGGDVELTARYGYSAMKLSHRWQTEADFESAASRLAAARAALGPAARLMMDCYMSWPVEVAAGMAELLAPYQPYWFRGRRDPPSTWPSWPPCARASSRCCWPAASTTTRRPPSRRSAATARSTSGSRTSPGPGASPARCASWSWRAATACRSSCTAVASRGGCT